MIYTFFYFSEAMKRSQQNYVLITQKHPKRAHMKVNYMKINYPKLDLGVYLC